MQRYEKNISWRRKNRHGPRLHTIAEGHGGGTFCWQPAVCVTCENTKGALISCLSPTMVGDKQEMSAGREQGWGWHGIALACYSSLRMECRQWV
ncbi:MAG: hypothetical protein SPJ13_05225 [Bacteroidales bacterium]|nr:hypothetical protein [Bacteroidales bacterium]